MTKTETEFNLIADEWRDGTRFHSFWQMSVKHPAYQILLQFGEDAVPFVLKRLASGDHSTIWSFLLCDLTGEHPDYEPEVEGAFAKFNVDAMAEAWLKWGKEHNQI